MHPYLHAQSTPEKLAIVNATTGDSRTFRQLDERSNQVAQYFSSQGISPGDAIAILMTNRIEYFECVWGAQRSGLYYVCISNQLNAEEIAYILRDSGARLLITCDRVDPDVVGQALCLSGNVAHLRVGNNDGSLDCYESRIGSMPTYPINNEVAGIDMLYSSGTTGFPKGIKRPLESKPIDAHAPITDLLTKLYGVSRKAIYLSPAPLYHAAPLRWSIGMHHLGATVVIMEKFDAAQYLAAIGKYQVTHSQVVPTMLGRLLALETHVRASFEISSLQAIIHAAAPCPEQVKEGMIDWLGPIIHEYYAGTESNGFVSLTSEEWLAHRGSVGRAIVGEIHICDDDGNEVSTGETGNIYFSGGSTFRYHNDPEKTESSRHPVHTTWSTLGDVGRVDDDGFLYLSDRKAFMIISGGVNIYPQEAENILMGHPTVADVAVFGVPDSDFGEAVKAVVQPEIWNLAGEPLATELLQFCRSKLSKIKCPKTIEFMKELPRAPTGKLYKKQLRDPYWAATATNE